MAFLWKGTFLGFSIFSHIYRYWKWYTTYTADIVPTAYCRCYSVMMLVLLFSGNKLFCLFSQFYLPQTILLFFSILTFQLLITMPFKLFIKSNKLRHLSLPCNHQHVHKRSQSTEFTRIHFSSNNIHWLSGKNSPLTVRYLLVLHNCTFHTG